jgi:hypothetical protein
MNNNASASSDADTYLGLISFLKAGAAVTVSGQFFYNCLWFFHNKRLFVFINTFIQCGSNRYEILLRIPLLQ